MINHIVLFKLLDEHQRDAAAIAEKFRESLASVDSIAELEVHQGMDGRGGSDIILVTRFRSADDFQSYLEDPVHLEAGRQVMACTKSVAVGDYSA